MTRLLKRQALRLLPDAGRVVVRPFRPATEPRAMNAIDTSRVNHIVERVLALDPPMLDGQWAEVLENFAGRHRNLRAACETRAADVELTLGAHPDFTAIQRWLIGAYFLQEYSFEAAALFNPSIVTHPSQAGVPAGARRVVVSLRAVGEGHISSLTFRSGCIAADGNVVIDEATRLASIPHVRNHSAGPDGDEIELQFEADADLSERVIFPVTLSQSNGIEDARFVEFDDDGQRIYYATYTAYNGRAIRSELLETRDFIQFRMSPLTGAASYNKGMALFPRRIDGRYAMIARQDNENLHLIYSDALYRWEGGVILLRPQFPWEFVQLGNCGSPIELDEGWLLLTHGVGPVRKYSIGAVLLDKDDPARVLGRSHQPLIRSESAEREGYVPNVVYTCGAIRHGSRIILPYAVSDTFCRFSSVEIAALLNSLT